MDLPAEENSFLNRLGFPFSSKLDCAYFIVSIAKTTLTKFEALILSMKFLSPGIVFYLYRTIVRPCTECYRHVSIGTCNYYLNIFDDLQK